ncbi:hypothetical protein [Spiroplasma endosymbiont of Amphibalanus improvisus]|uniref:MarR family winged helix-turn-helix transcriptional regulator n=1 Tax=Spiroplasma endosymbiont of Amphibalanus improvisus TaxID=3066327 RepID=UPI00313C526B
MNRDNKPLISSSSIQTIFECRKLMENYIRKRLFDLNIHDFKPANFWLISIIANNRESNMVTIARKFHYTKANLTVVANNLIEKKYITKSISKVNNKNLVLQLTDKGFKLYHVIKIIIRDLQRLLSSMLDQEEIEQLTNIMFKLSNKLLQDDDIKQMNP